MKDTEEITALRDKYRCESMEEKAALMTRPKDGESLPEIQRFQHDCWNVSYLTTMPRISHEGKRLSLVQMAWTLAWGPIPPRQRTHRLCRNPLCFNPYHMYLKGKDADPIHLSNASDALMLPDQSLNPKCLHGAKQSRPKQAPGQLALARAHIKLLEQEIDALTNQTTELQDEVAQLTEALIESETARINLKEQLDNSQNQGTI